MEPSTLPTEPVRFGVFELDLRTGELRKSGVRVKLQEQSFQILQALLKNPGAVVTREELRKTIWPADTFVEFDHGLYSAMTRLREVLADSAETPRFIETLSRRGYRFVAPVDRPSSSTLQTPTRAAPMPQQAALEPPAARKSSRFRWAAIVSGAAMLFVGIALSVWLLYFRKAHGLTEKDSIVVADFANSTGDAVFDGTLRQGLAVQLEQSPFFAILSGDQIAGTLRMMEKSADTRLTPDVAREVCQRANATVTIEGSIAALGSQYVLGLNAVNCRTGEALADEQVTAEGKEKILSALGTAASELRSKLGESRASLEAHDVALYQGTTNSLEALQAISRATQAFWNFDMSGTASFAARAVALDPNFAGAYSLLGAVQGMMGDPRAVENNKKAYELRDRVTEYENFEISRNYHIFVTGDLDTALQVTQQLRQAYPHDRTVPNGLADCYQRLGRYDEALTSSLEAVQGNPTADSYVLLFLSYLGLGRLDDALATVEQARRAFHVDSSFFGLGLWYIAQSRNDQAGMSANEAAARRNDPMIDLVLPWDQGRLSRVRDLYRGIIASGMQANREDVAAATESYLALGDALVGKFADGRAAATKASEMSSSWTTLGRAGLVLAIAGDSAGSQMMADDVNRRFPDATLIRFHYLPAIRAVLALRQGKPQDAIDDLSITASYDLLDDSEMMPVYIRGQAYLAGHQGTQAAEEFQKILDHPGLTNVAYTPVTALSHLGLARAYALQGDTAKASAAYQDFLTLWKDADPDIPILKQAKAEYAKLQ
jgi:DNA-binding winged helix-turn-helix (wHTH) protein/tetratricopeptide (TPR) repeat protein